MRTLWRMVRLVLAIVLVLVLVLGALVAWVTIRAFPQTGGTVEVAGLDAPATIERDEHGILQVSADTPADLFFAQGYAHAQERLWQMEVWRHIGAGRLSELFGESQLETDRFIRSLDWRGAARTDLEAMRPETVALLQAYADGVNAFIDGHAGSLGFPFVFVGLRAGLDGGLGGYTPEPWTALDSATWQKVQSWNLGGNFASEVFRLLADDRLPDPSMTDELIPPYPADAPIIAPTDRLAAAAGRVVPQATAEGAPAGRPRTARMTASQAGALLAAGRIGERISALAGLDAAGGLASKGGIGSNHWVIGPERSTTGGALLANDPHLGIGMPSVWIMNGLHCRTVSEDCPWDVAGVSFPGAPGVVLGHNGRIAWGATNVDPDVQDIFRETADPARPDTHYLYKGRSTPFTTRVEEIRVAGGETETLRVRQTVHGPVLNDVDDRLRELPDLFALQWAATAEPDLTLEAIMAIDLADDFDEFRAAFDGYGTPSQNFVYADVDGHIGYVMPGRIPVRPEDDLGDRPVDGASGAHDWQGYVPRDELPVLDDPPGARIVTANNAVVDDEYPHLLGREWDPGDRAARILERLDAAGADGVSLDEMGDIQMDAMPIRFRHIAGQLARATPMSDDGRTVASRIGDWDGTCSIESAGCAAYMVAEYRLLRAVFDDELGWLAREYVGTPFSWQLLADLLGRRDDRWWDDTTTTDRVEMREEILARALDAAGADLRRDLGEPADWTWGRLHTTTWQEATLGQSEILLLEWYFNQGPTAAPGAGGAPNNAYWRFEDAYDDPFDEDDVPTDDLRDLFAVTNLPSYRLAIDMADLDGARIIITTGQSGNPFAPHYGDLTDEWASGESVPLPFSRAAVDAATVSTLTLEPTGAEP
jgi:penicillin amidase